LLVVFPWLFTLEIEMENIRENLYNIYVKSKGMKRFKPLDLKNNRPVVNLIYASLLNHKDAYEVLLELREHNPTMEFKKVKVT
jgi:hypothetical protein